MFKTLLSLYFLLFITTFIFGQKAVPSIWNTAKSISVSYGAPVDTVLHFIHAAQKLEKQEGIPAAVVIGIAILESSGFTSYLYIHSRNPFGLKATKPWEGNTFSMWHEGEMTPFRYYRDADAAVKDFAAMLHSRRWFDDAFQCPKADYKCFIKGLSASSHQPGWARDPNWGAKVLDIIQRYNLMGLSKP